MRINAARRELRLKIVYYGAGLSGKTTNLAWLHDLCPPGRRGKLTQLDTETERTLFFDYFPLSLGVAGNYRIRVDYFTVPGQSFYHATRQAVLEGADGVVFVADSSPDREDANLLSREDLVRSLEARGRALVDVPHVYQWNKRDVPRALSVATLRRMLNPEGAEGVEAVAVDGIGVWDTQQLIVRKVVAELRTQGVVALEGDHA